MTLSEHNAIERAYRSQYITVKPVVENNTVVLNESARPEVHGPQCVDAEAYNIEWDQYDRYEVQSEGGELVSRYTADGITYDPDVDDMEELLKERLNDEFGCYPVSLDYDILDWHGEVDEDTISDWINKPAVDFMDGARQHDQSIPEPKDGDIVMSLDECFEKMLSSVSECITESEKDATDKIKVMDALSKLKGQVKDPRDVERFMAKYGTKLNAIEDGISKPEERSAFRKTMDFINGALKSGWNFIKRHWGKILIALAILLVYIYWPRAGAPASMFGWKLFGDGAAIDAKDGVADFGKDSVGTDEPSHGATDNSGTHDGTKTGDGSVGGATTVNPTTVGDVNKPATDDGSIVVGDDAINGTDGNASTDNGTNDYWIGYHDPNAGQSKTLIPSDMDDSDIDWTRPLHYGPDLSDDGSNERQLLRYQDHNGKWHDVNWGDNLITSDDLNESDEDDETSYEQYPRPCEKLYNTKTVAAAQNYIRKAVDPYVKGYFRDEDWSNVRKVFEVMSRELGMNVNWGVRNDNYYHAGYSLDGKSKAYMFDAKYTNCVGRQIKINGQIIASGAGSVEYPLERYDMIFQLF